MLDGREHLGFRFLHLGPVFWSGGGGDTFDLSTWEPEWEEWVQDNQGYREPVLGTASLLFLKQGFSNFKLVFNPLVSQEQGLWVYATRPGSSSPSVHMKVTSSQAAGYCSVCTSRTPVSDHLHRIVNSQIKKSIGNNRPFVSFQCYSLKFVNSLI